MNAFGLFSPHRQHAIHFCFAETGGSVVGERGEGDADVAGDRARRGDFVSDGVDAHGVGAVDGGLPGLVVG